MALQYSVIIPFFNEEQSLTELHRQLRAVLEPLGTYELVYIDDGSTDGSFAAARQLFHDDQHVSVLQLRRNFGKSVALAAGFARARGSVVITIDADLQDEPKEIPALVAMLQHADLIVGWKAQRSDPWTKTFPSRVFNGIARSLFHLALHDINSGLKVMRREVAQEVQLYGELHRFVPILASLQGFSVAEKPVVHHERRFGKSKYGWRRFVRGSFDLVSMAFLARFRNSPLHLFGTIGTLFVAIGCALGVYLSVLHFQGVSIGQRPLLLLSVLAIVTGLQFFFTGLLADLLASRSVPQKPPVRSVLDHEALQR